MNTVAGTRFAVKPVVAALALAFSAVNAYADPTPTQLPGGGLIRAVNTGTTISSPSVFYVVTGTGTAGDQVVNGSPGAPFFPGSIQLDNAGAVARAVIRWGGNAGSAELFNPQGFNIGQNATVFFTSAATVTSAAVLNIDASGNPSQIFGKLIGTSDTKLGTGVAVPGVGGGAAPAIFVANTNGIIVGPLGQVQSPTGVALIAADLTNTSATPSTAEWDFVGNNGATSPAPPGVSGPSYLDVMGGITNKSKIDIRGFIDGGGALFNQPAAYVLLVGGDVVNTGNIFGSRIDVLAGMRGYSSTTASDTVNGISKVAVQRLFNVDTGFATFNAVGNECTTSSACLEVSRTASTILNTGTISSKSPGGYIGMYASGGASGIRTGTLGDTNPLVGIFSDNAVIMNTYEPGSTIELYGVMSGFSLNVLLPSLAVNQAGGWNGDVTVHTVQRGTEPSMLTTTGDVRIRGVNVLIDSTINDKYAGQGGAQLDSTLDIVSTNSVTINKAVGAGRDVNITNSGAGGINIAAAVNSDTDNGGAGDVNVTNTGSGSPTTISGNLNARNENGLNNGGNVNIGVNGMLNITGSLDAGYDVNITNNKVGAATSINNGHMFPDRDFNMTVSGPTDVTSNIFPLRDANITQNSLASGNTTTFAGTITAFNDINITNNGGITSKLYVDSAVTATSTWDGYSAVNISSGGDLRLGSVANAAAGSGSDTAIFSNGLNVALTNTQATDDTWSFSAPNALTKVYTAAQVSAGTINLNTLNFRGVQNDGTNYTNASQKPAWQLMTNTLNLTAWGSINAPITGNTNWLLNQMQVKAAVPGVPVFATLSAVGGGFQAINLGFTGDLVVNSGATLTPFAIVGFSSPVLFPPPLVANGGSQLILQASGNMDINGTAGPLFPLAPVSFQFPGGVVFKAGGYVSLNAPLYNAWNVGGAAFQGVFFEAPTIITTSYIATNTLNWVNYSSYPATGPANAYVIQQPAPGEFQFMPFPNATHYNVYSLEVVGGAPCTTPNPSPPWPPAGC